MGIGQIKAVRYRTINDCLAAYFDCRPKDIPADGKWIWMDADGVRVETNQVRALADIRQRNVWGWVENKHTIHFFARKRASLRELVRFFSHEIGHQMRPFHRSVIEERKAERYSRVALMALDAAMEVFGG